MPATIPFQSVSSFTSSSTLSNFSGYTNASVSSPNLVLSGSFPCIWSNTPSDVQKIRVTAKPQNGLTIFCSSTAIDSNNFNGVCFEIKYIGNETLFRLYANPTSSTLSSESAASLISECPMPKSMSRNTSYEFELTVGRYGWQVTYLKNSKRVPLLQLPIFSSTAFPTSTIKNNFKIPQSKYCGVLNYGVAGSTVLVDSISTFYGGNQGNPYGIETTLLDCTSPPTQNPWQPSSFTNKLDAKTSITNFSINSGTSYLTIPQTITTGGNTGSAQFINSMSNTNGDGVSLDDIPVVIIKFDWINGETILSLDYDGTGTNYFFNSDIASAGTFKAVTEETNGLPMG